MAGSDFNLTHFTIESHRNSEARAAEDWSGLASAAERRRIQNRINARVHRRKKVDLRIRNAQTLALLRDSPSTNSLESSTSIVVYSGDGSSHQQACGKPTNWTPAKIFEARTMNAAFLSRNFHLPSADLLLSLVSHNVFRAFLSNFALLGFNHSQFSCEESQSPFNKGASEEHLPPNFQPTAIQRKVHHHPVFDAFPDPQLRERIILWQITHEDDDLCLILIGGSDTHGEVPQGLMVWGEPNRIDSWEVTETFSREWWFLLSGCDELIRSSNKWRARRGEGPLTIKRASLLKQTVEVQEQVDSSKPVHWK